MIKLPLVILVLVVVKSDLNKVIDDKNESVSVSVQDDDKIDEIIVTWLFTLTWLLCIYLYKLCLDKSDCVNFRKKKQFLRNRKSRKKFDKESETLCIKNILRRRRPEEVLLKRKYRSNCELSKYDKIEKQDKFLVIKIILNLSKNFIIFIFGDVAFDLNIFSNVKSRK